MPNVMLVETGRWVITLFGFTLSVSPYVLFNGAGFILGLLLLDSILAKDLPDYQNPLYFRFVFSFVAGWIGAYLFDWWIGNSSFLQSGFTFYGGFGAGILCFFLSSYRHFSGNVIWRSINDATIPLLLCHAFGRIGCFFSGCCYGKSIPLHNPLGLYFVIHPTQLYESLFLFSLAFFLYKIRNKYPLFLVWVYFFSYSIFRFLLEFLRGDPRTIFSGLSVSQWISLVLLILTVLSSLHSFYRTGSFAIERGVGDKHCQ